MSSPTRYQTIVVGGGHNGLTCAAYLARGGQRVLVLERRSRLGGASVTEEVWPGYRVSTLSYVVSLLRPAVVRELQLARFGYRVYPLDPAYFMPFPDGRHLLFWEEPERAAEELRRFSPADAEALTDYDRTLGELVGLVRPLLDRTPPRLPPRLPGDLSRGLSLGAHLLRHRRRWSKLADILTMSVADYLSQWFSDEAVKGALSPGGVIGAWAGPETPGTAYILLHHRMGEVAGRRGGWAFVRGGMGAVAGALAQSARAQGADLRTDSPVERIRVVGGRALGVTLADGTELSADRVVSSAHPTTTLLGMVGSAQLPAELVREMQRYRTRSGSAKVNLALAELPDFTALPGTRLGPQHPEFIINPSLAYLQQAFDEARRGHWSSSPMLDCVIPTTKDDSLAPPGRHILSCFVQYTPRDLESGSWEGERERLGDRVVELLGQYAPNLPGAVLHRQVVTPADLEVEYGLLGGNIFQGEMTLDQLLSLRPAPQVGSYSTPIAGLYLCGAGTHPGGGVMGSPGRNAARLILRQARSRRLARLGRPA